MFGMWSKLRQWDEPHPETGKIWINDNAEVSAEKYTRKFKDHHGEEADPTTLPLDVDVVMLAGEGKRKGRLLIGDGSVNATYIPTMRQVRKGLKPGDSGVERRVPASERAFDELRVCYSDKVNFPQCFALQHS